MPGKLPIDRVREREYAPRIFEQQKKLLTEKAPPPVQERQDKPATNQQPEPQPDTETNQIGQKDSDG